MLINIDQPLINIEHNFDNNPWGNFIARLSPQILDFYPESEFPFFVIVRNQLDNSVRYKEYLYPGTWAAWMYPSNTKFEIYTKTKFIKSLDWDQAIHGNSCEMLFYEWCSMNKGSVGISIGSHSGVNGEWVQPTQQGMITTHCVEPSDKQFNELKTNFSQNRNVTFSKHLVTPEGGRTIFYEGDYEGGALNTTNKKILNAHPYFTEREIESISINDLFQKLTTKSPDFLHIDAEGLDMDLILSIDKNLGLPKCIIYEHPANKSDKEEELYIWFEENNYHWVRTECANTIAFLRTGIISPKMNWGELDVNISNAMTLEIFNEKIYTKSFSVEKGDIVVDIGASAGPFVNSILQYEPSIIYCVEPVKIALDLCKENIGGLVNTKYLNYAIGVETDEYGIFNEQFHSDQIEFDKVPFMEFIESNNIDHIDFLKLDCEGGEYHIFSGENIQWIKDHVSKISGEWHLAQNTPNFLNFRDNVLPLFPNYKVYSLDSVDITDTLFTDWFDNHYTEIIVTIDNRDSVIIS